jgi:hypothetical protein
MARKRGLNQLAPSASSTRPDRASSERLTDFVGISLRGSPWNRGTSGGQPLSATVKRASSRRFVAAGLVLGIGLGGFVDGIVLHQILQWHHMLTSTNTDNIGLPDYPATTVRGLEVNTL